MSFIVYLQKINSLIKGDLRIKTKAFTGKMAKNPLPINAFVYPINPTKK